MFFQTVKQAIKFDRASSYKGSYGKYSNKEVEQKLTVKNLWYSKLWTARNWSLFPTKHLEFFPNYKGLKLVEDIQFITTVQ